MSYKGVMRLVVVQMLDSDDKLASRVRWEEEMKA